MQQFDLTDKFLASSDALLFAARNLENPENLLPPSAGDETENGRKALRLLRTLHGITKDMEEWLRLGDQRVQLGKVEMLQSLVGVYAGLVKITHLQNPELLAHFTVENANFSCGGIALAASLHTLEAATDDSPVLESLEKGLEQFPQEWEVRLAQAVEYLLNDIEGGLSHLANKPMGDKSPIDKLVEISEKIQQTASELCSVDALEEPAREESIELAREILRRLKNMLFSDKPIEEAIDTGKPNDKLAFARKIAEMAEMYKNLLKQAAINDPSILNDPRVKKANDAVGKCADGITQMTLHELAMANSANALSRQQIEKAEKLQETLSKKGKGERKTTENLMKSVEGGVESAAKSLSGNQQKDNLDRARAQQQAQQRIEAARMVRRRLRREQMAARAAAEKVSTAVASAPRPARTQETAAPVISKPAKPALGGINLNSEALAAVRQAGATLKSSSRQAMTISTENAKIATQAAAQSNSGGGSKSHPSVADKGENVSTSDNVAPDDKTFTQREQDQKNNPKNRPRIV